MISFSNHYFQFRFNPSTGCFSLDFPAHQIRISDAFLQVSAARQGQPEPDAPANWETDPFAPRQTSSPHGTMRRISLHSHPDAHGLAYHLTFAFPEKSPLFLWKLRIDNLGDSPIFIDRIDMLCAGGFPSPFEGTPPSTLTVGGPQTDPRLAFFSNGWQSWSHTGVFETNQSGRTTRLKAIQTPMIQNAGTPMPSDRGHFASDFFGVVGSRSARVGLLAGFLSQKEQFGSLEVRLRGPLSLRLWANGDGVELPKGRQMETDWAVCTPIDLDAPDPMKNYLEAVAREHSVEYLPEVPLGWCSWYQFYQKISQPIIEQNLETLRGLKSEFPVDLVQIDDGFEAQVGDWLDFHPAFPQGVAPLAQKISQSGFTPGLWLAPFIVHPGAKLVRQHPDFLLRNAAGRPVNAGFVWNAFTTALDLTHASALEYACQVVDTAAHRWGYPYLKLDFLYAAALPGKHRDSTLTRAQILRRGLEALRQAAGEKTFLLHCGAPLGSSLGLCEAMRIGADVSGDWTPRYFGLQSIFREERQMPSARNSIQNILTRAPLHRRWWINDPDCLLVRPDSHLTLPEIQSLASAIALTGGSLLVSDNLPQLPAERLRLAAALAPTLGKSAEILDWFDRSTPCFLRLPLQGAVGNWFLLAYFNWQDHPQEVRLTPANFRLPSDGVSYRVRSYWDGELRICAPGQPLWSGTLAPHGVVVLAVREQAENTPQYLGSDLHISQGLEVSAWEVQPGRLSLEVNLARRAAGQVFLSLPAEPTAACAGDGPLEIKKLGNNLFSLHLSIDPSARVVVDF